MNRRNMVSVLHAPASNKYSSSRNVISGSEQTMRLSAVITILAGLLLAACETMTPYQQATGLAYGYSDQQIERNRWSVSFSGNSLTDRQTVETYLLFRAAELTLESGYDYFEVVARQTDTETRFVSQLFATPFYYNFHGFGPHQGFHHGRLGGSQRGPAQLTRHHQSLYRPFGSYHDPFYGGPGQFEERVSYQASAEIFLRTGDKPEDIAYFDARDVIANLSDAVIRPDAAAPDERADVDQL